MKALGADIREFYDNNWPAGYFHDDNSLEIHVSEGPREGEWILEPSEKYDLKDLGVLVAEEGGECQSFETMFRRWYKQRGMKTLVVSVPEAEFEGIRDLLKAKGCRLE